MLAYLDSLIGMFRTGGFSVDLTHHVMHALGSRMWGFTLLLDGFERLQQREPLHVQRLDPGGVG